MKKGIIIGAGIGGLTTAIALLKKGIDVSVFEQAKELTDVGAGIWVAPNAMKVFDKLGIAEDLMKAGTTLDKISVVDLNLRPISTINGSDIKSKHQFATLAIHRATLLKILASYIPSDKIITHKKFVSYEQSEHSVTAEFEDGTRVSADFLVCADGIQSKGRLQMQPDQHLRYSGQTCWRFVTDFDLPEAEEKNMYEIWSLKKGLRVGYSKINDREVYVYITNFEKAGGRDHTPTVQQDLLNLCSEFPAAVKELILAANPHRIIRNDLYDFKPINQWTDRKTVLVGDAAHATTPNLGQGACQAIEDAYVLAEQLSTCEDIEKSFKLFQEKRISKATSITNTSWQFAQITNTSGVIKSLIIGFLRMTPNSINHQQLDKIYSLDY